MEILNVKKCGRTVPSFLKKTYEMLEDLINDPIVRWTPSGVGFMILNQAQFSRTILPKYFKHNKYSSFVRQLNMYNFHKVRSNANQNCFIHEKFIRNDINSIQNIKRKTQRKKKKMESDEMSCQKLDSEQENQQKSQIKSISKPKLGSFKQRSPYKKLNNKNLVQITDKSNVLIEQPPSICFKNTPLNSNTFTQKQCPVTGVQLQDYDDNISIQDGIQNAERSYLRIPTKLLLLNQGSVVFPINTGMISAYSMSSLIK